MKYNYAHVEFIADELGRTVRLQIQNNGYASKRVTAAYFKEWVAAGKPIVEFTSARTTNQGYLVAHGGRYYYTHGRLPR